MNYMGKYKPIEELFDERNLEEGSIVEFVSFIGDVPENKTLVRSGRIGENNADMNLLVPFPTVDFETGRVYTFTIWQDGSITNPITAGVEKGFYGGYRVVERA